MKLRVFNLIRSFAKINVRIVHLKGKESTKWFNQMSTVKKFTEIIVRTVISSSQI